MTTFDERKRALTSARAWLEGVTEGVNTELAMAARALLKAYPEASLIERQLLGVHGYRLIAALHSLERTAFILAWAAQEASPPHAGTARKLLRHFPERLGLERALTTPQLAAAWTSFNLDRPPGRIAVLMAPVPPTSDGASEGRVSTRQRRAALNSLLPFLEALAVDQTLPAVVYTDARRLCTGPLQSMFPALSGVRDRTPVSTRSFNAWFTALQDACHLIHAIGDGWFPADRRVLASAQQLGKGLPDPTGFPITEIDDAHCQAWLNWILLPQPQRLNLIRPLMRIGARA